MFDFKTHLYEKKSELEISLSEANIICTDYNNSTKGLSNQTLNQVPLKIKVLK